MSDWCILRCSGRSTLPLADSLKRSGIEAWSPAAILSGAKLAPMTPTYVFASAGRVLDLIRLAACRGGDHHGFSVMHRPQGIPLIRDGQLDGLRKQEDDARPKLIERKPRWRMAERFEIGEEIKVGQVAGFEGMEGIVEQSDERETIVGFGGWMTLKIETWILRPDDIGTDVPNFGQAA